MKTLTLGFLTKGDELLLAMKKRGFGAGNWNGYGGKLEEGEMPLDALVREVYEESGITIGVAQVSDEGRMRFHFSDKPEWDQEVIVYRISEWEGEPIETEEMKPQWFKFSEIPWSEMWAGDEEWIPYFLRGEKFTGEIHFAEGGKKVVSVTVNKN